MRETSHKSDNLSGGAAAEKGETKGPAAASGDGGGGGKPPGDGGWSEMSAPQVGQGLRETHVADKAAAAKMGDGGQGGDAAAAKPAEAKPAGSDSAAAAKMGDQAAAKPNEPG